MKSLKCSRPCHNSAVRVIRLPGRRVPPLHLQAPCTSSSSSSFYELLSDAPISSPQPSRPDPQLINEDNRPSQQDERSWTLSDFFAFWIAMVVCIPTWHLACGLLAQGFSLAQALAVVFVGTVITLGPMLASSAIGAKTGLGFPVLARASFGIRGAHIPSLTRAIVACGWYGVSTWIGATCLQQLVAIVAPSISLDLAWSTWSATYISSLGISISQAVCFAAFWAVQVIAVSFGMEFIKIIEKGSAPVLVALSLALLLWSLTATRGDLGPLFSSPSQFIPGGQKEGQILSKLLPAVTAIVAFWGTLALNISDFSRYAQSQRSQALGQALALPLGMAGFALLALTVSSTTLLIFGKMVTDPVAIVGRMQGPVAGLALCGLLLATLSTNVAANVVGPSNAIVNVNPKRITFGTASIVTAVLGALIQPWRLVESESFFQFLLSYSVLLGPVLGIFLCDFWIVRRGVIDVSSLFKHGPGSSYWYLNGVNLAAMGAVLAGLAPTLPGCLTSLGLVSYNGLFTFLFEISFFVGAFVSSVVYYLLMKNQ